MCREESLDPNEASKFVQVISKQQRESLETLHLQSLYHGLLGVRLSGLKRLKELDIELWVLMGSVYDRPCHEDGRALNGIPIDELLPPTLERLTLRYTVLNRDSQKNLRITALRRLLADKQTFLPSFRKLTLLRESGGAGGAEADAVFAEMEELCRIARVDLVDGGICQEGSRWDQWESRFPP